MDNAPTNATFTTVSLYKLYIYNIYIYTYIIILYEFSIAHILLLMFSLSEVPD